MKTFNQLVDEGVLTAIGRKKPEKKAQKAMDAGAKARRKVARRVHAKYVSGSEDLVPDDIREGMIDVIKKGAKRHAKAVEKKKIKNRKAVPYAALAAQHEPEGEVLDEADPRLAIYQSGMTDASRVKGRVGKTVDKVKDKVKRVLGKKDKVSSHLDRYRYQSGLDNYLKSKVKKEELAIEAKVDAGKSPEEKEKVRNVRKFGVSHNVAGHGKLRRALHRSDRGDKKIKGDKSAYVEMEAVVNEANRGEKEVDASNLKKVGRRNINRFETGTVKRTESSGGRKPTYKTVTLANPKPGYGKKSDHYKKNKLSAPSLGRHGTSSETEKGPQKHHTQGVEYHDAAQKQRRQEHKAKRGVKTKGTVAADIKKSLKEEDKAYDYVVSKLKKKYGDGVLTKGDKIKPQSAAEKAKVRAHQAKIDKENAAERAKDPSQGRYPPGYSNRGSD